MTTFALTAALLLLGMTLRQLALLPSNAHQSLSAFVIHVSLPALILARVPMLQLNGLVWPPLVLPWLMVGVSAAMIWGFSRLFSWSREVTGALMLVVPLGNTSFLGIPMVEAFYGADGVPWAVLYDQLGSFLALSTWGAFVVATWARGSAPSAQQVLMKILRFPPFIALTIALATLTLPHPAALMQVLDGVAASLVPVVMVAVGLQLQFKLPRDERGPFFVGLLTKLVLAPAIALVFCRFMGWGGLATDVSILEAAMPPMVIASVVATSAGLAPRLVGAMVGSGIVMAFVTLPIWFWLLSR